MSSSSSSSPSSMVITDFSGGYGGNGQARTVSGTELAIASGIIPQSPNERDLLIVSLLQKAGIKDTHALSKIIEHRLDYDLILSESRRDHGAQAEHRKLSFRRDLVLIGVKLGDAIRIISAAGRIHFDVDEGDEYDSGY